MIYPFHETMETLGAPDYNDDMRPCEIGSVVIYVRNRNKRRQDAKNPDSLVSTILHSNSQFLDSNFGELALLH